jgi:CBS domain containing-hemolysin-like protein
VAPALPGLIGLIALLLLSAYFSVAQVALTNARRPALREQAERGNERARLAAQMAEDSSRVLNTFQLASALSYFLIAGLIAMFLLPHLVGWLSERLPVIASAGNLIVYLVVIPLAGLLTFLFVDLLPGMLVHREPEKWALALAPLIQVTLGLLLPLVALVAFVRRQIATPLGDAESGQITEEEIMTLVDAGEEEGTIELEEKEMIYSIFQLDETLAREIMVPRIDIVAFDIDTPLEEAREVIIRAGHSRVPVFEESLDHIKGLLYAKDLLRVWHEGKQSVDLRSLLRPALFVPESKRVSDLLRELQSAKVHMAIVIDEYGGTAGLVTIEDIVEEIVGEILDEYDEAEEAPYQVVGADEYIFDARVSLDDINHLMDAELSDELGDTLAGFIYGQLGKVPVPGETIETDCLHMEVLSVDDRRIRKVRVKRIPRSSTNGGINVTSTPRS